MAVFGAGQFGRMALEKYGESVECFIDNSAEVCKQDIDGIPIISLELFLREHNKDDYQIVIATRARKTIENQLKNAGVRDYVGFPEDERAYYDTAEIVYDTYKMQDVNVTETQWNEHLNEKMILEVDSFVENLREDLPLFDHIEIETVNRCNGGCDFCPVSKNRDPRKYQLMDEALFKKIISELEELDYNGKFALFSNNEPFLDERIIEWQKYARGHVKNARMHLFTNGTLLSLDKFLRIIDYLDELIIDNYHAEGKLLTNSRKIRDYCQLHPELANKVTIVIRNPHEILSSRGGAAPNRKEVKTFEMHRCVLPYRQMIIRPSGKVSLCCNDPLGQVTLGDLNIQSLKEVWYGERFEDIRKKLYDGRKNIDICCSCDNISLG